MVQPIQQYIAHFDLDSFFVSVELLKQPQLRNLPVIVGGSSNRGVVTSCSYEARKFGVRSAMPVMQAKKLCPHAVFLKGHFQEYKFFSAKVTDIISAKAPMFQKASIDEFYLNLTGMDRYFDVLEWTKQLRNEIIEQTNLPISFGLASTKLIAKIATGMAKPNGFLFVKPGNEKSFLSELNVDKIPGVGHQSLKALNDLGIRKIGDVLKFTPTQLYNHLGKWGAVLHQKASGDYDDPIHPEPDSKSISSETTFDHDSDDQSFLIENLVVLCEKTAFELRKDKKLTGCIALKMRTADFKTVNRQMKIALTDKDDELITAAKSIFSKMYLNKQPLRLLGVKFSRLCNPVQPMLFENHCHNGLYHMIDEVKNKFGKDILVRASSIEKRDGY